MKKILSFVVAVLIAESSLLAQNTPDKEIKPGKKSQTDLYNDFYAGYGALSLFYFTGRMKHSSGYPTESDYINDQYIYEPKYTQTTSPGTFFAGYQRSLNKVVGLGFMFGYQSISYDETYYTSQYDSTRYKIHSDDQLMTGIARVTFSYLNKPSIRLYSGIGIGVTVDFGKVTGDVEETTERKIWPAGQLTLMGVRFGRAFGGFMEFGFGSYGILNVGLSYKFAD